MSAFFVKKNQSDPPFRVPPDAGNVELSVFTFERAQQSAGAQLPFRFTAAIRVGFEANRFHKITVKVKDLNLNWAHKEVSLRGTAEVIEPSGPSAGGKTLRTAREKPVRGESLTRGLGSPVQRRAGRKRKG